MDLNIRQLRYFVTIAETGTFSKAAAEMFITTPSLSQQIAKLERQLGFRLFDRGPKGTRLSVDGEAFIDVAKELLGTHDRAVHIAQERRSALAAEPVTTFRLGFQVGMLGTSTADILAEFRALEPACELVLTQLSWSQQIAGVAQGTLDAALVRPPLPPSSLQVIPLVHEPRALVTSRRHPLATQETITIADLGGLVQVRAAGVSPEWESWWAIDPRPDGTRVRYGHLVHSVEEMLQVVAATDCVSITPASFATLFPRADVVYIPITDAEPSRLELVLQPGPISTAAASLLSAVRNAVDH